MTQGLERRGVRHSDVFAGLGAHPGTASQTLRRDGLQTNIQSPKPCFHIIPILAEKCRSTSGASTMRTPRMVSLMLLT